MFSKNEDNKHKSLLSKQELSAFNAKKKKKKPETSRQILLSLHTGWTNVEPLIPICKAPGQGAPRRLAGFFHTCHGAEARSLRYAEAVGMLLFGVYIQTHPRLMYFYTYMYTHMEACYSFLETTSSTSGS